MQDIKVYAGRVTSINRNPKTASGRAVTCLVQIYGWYDNKAMATLHWREQAVVTVWFNLDHPVLKDISVGSRLAIPAEGISAEGRELEGYRGTFTMYDLIGIEKRSIVVLNKQDLQDDSAAYVKSTTSRVVAGAKAGVLERLAKLFGSLV